LICLLKKIGHVYDNMGNRLTRVVGGTTDTYATFGTSNRINTITTGSNVRSFTYLPTGQVSGDTRDPSDAYVYTYNQTGRLTSAALNGSTVGTYLVNGLEQRVAKTVGSTTTHYIFDRFGHLLSEANGSTGAIQKEYIWLDDLLVAEIDDTGSSPVMYYVHTDHLGRPQKMTDATATVVWDGVFDPFGNVTSVTGSTTNLVMFPGQYYDSETQLSQNWNRDYDPTIGKYVQSDPIGLTGGINIYTYVGGNPLKYTDPLGLFAPWGWSAAAAAEAAGGGPEDPFADLAAAGLLAAATMSDGPGAGGNQIPPNNNGKNCPDPDCEHLIQQIENHIALMQTVYDDMMIDEYNLYNLAYRVNPGGSLAGFGTWLGHVGRYNGLVTGLSRMIANAEAKKCPIPKDAYNWLGTSAPSAPGMP
jgi:RHS repeat-associated protein